MQLSPKTFQYQGKEFEYFDHLHHETYLCERRVEIPVTLDWLKQFKGKKILEVGNTMSWYYPPGIIDVVWDIVDKYEIVPQHNVINEDILTYKPKGEKYDMVFSISTMEHVGWDHEREYPGEHGDFRKSVKAIKNIQKNCLKKGGKMMMTLPWNYNAVIHVALFSGELGKWKTSLMRRMTRDNRWIQIRYLEQFGLSRYSYPFYAGNGIIFAYYEKA